MSDQGNIFLTYENLAFSMPLILVVGVYVIFTYVPFYITALCALSIFAVFQIRQQMAAHKEKKLATLDESVIKDLIGEEEVEEEAKKKEEEKKKQKAKNKVQQRLATEKKAEAKQGSSNGKKKL